jgi:hypothetical protein
VLCQLSYSHRHCDYSNCDSELSEFRRAAGRYRKREDCIPKQESRLSGLFLVRPVFTIFFVVNVFWGALILVSQRWRRGYLCLLTAVITLVAAVIDFAHH